MLQSIATLRQCVFSVSGIQLDVTPQINYQLESKQDRDGVDRLFGSEDSLEFHFYCDHGINVIP